jgi:hypothetical protein
VLDEVDLVHVAALDRRLHRLDGGGVGVLVPGPAPLADPEGGGGRTRLELGPYLARGERERTGLGRIGVPPSPKRARKPVAEIEIGDDVFRSAAEEPGGAKVILDRSERAVRGMQFSTCGTLPGTAFRIPAWTLGQSASSTPAPEA